MGLNTDALCKTHKVLIRLKLLDHKTTMESHLVVYEIVVVYKNYEYNLFLTKTNYSWAAVIQKACSKNFVNLIVLIEFV